MRQVITPKAYGIGTNDIQYPVREDLPGNVYLLNFEDECRLCAERKVKGRVVDIVEEAYPDREAALDAYRRINSYGFHSYKTYRELY